MDGLHGWMKAINTTIKMLKYAPIIKNYHRITSYNVCYTKLLRNPFGPELQVKQMLDLQDRINLILKYSIRYDYLF